MTYGFISKENVNVRQEFHHWLFEDGTQERGGQIHAEKSVPLTGKLGHFQHALWGHCQGETLKSKKIIK